MVSKSLVAAVALASTAYAQLDSKCNPLTSSCPADPAFGNQKVHCDLTKSLCDELKPVAGTNVKSFSEKGALFSIEADKQAPTLVTEKYLFFGRLDVTLQAAPGAGIITSIVLFSDDKDEIDWEFIGNSDKVQSNTFSKGDDTKHDLVSFNPVADPFGSAHTYSIEWTKDAINWSIDGKVVHTVTEASIPDRFPQTPMYARIGTWVAGGPDSPPGTTEWAGGKTDFSQAPFNAYYKSVSIVDYAGGNGPSPNKVNSYSYGDQSGKWESIKFDPEGSGNVGGGSDNNKPSDKPTDTPPSSTSKPAEQTSSEIKTTLVPVTSTSQAADSTSTPVDETSAEPTQTGVATQTQSPGGNTTIPTSPPQSSGARNGIAAGALAVAVAALFGML